MIDKKDDQYSAKEAAACFEAALKGALRAPHKPLKDKPKVKKTAKKSGRAKKK